LYMEMMFLEGDLEHKLHQCYRISLQLFMFETHACFIKALPFRKSEIRIWLPTEIFRVTTDELDL